MASSDRPWSDEPRLGGSRAGHCAAPGLAPLQRVRFDASHAGRRRRTCVAIRFAGLGALPHQGGVSFRTWAPFVAAVAVVGDLPYAVESGYGGPYALKEFVRQVHEEGIAVVLDFVQPLWGLPTSSTAWEVRRVARGRRRHLLLQRLAPDHALAVTPARLRTAGIAAVCPRRRVDVALGVPRPSWTAADLAPVLTPLQEEIARLRSESAELRGQLGARAATNEHGGCLTRRTPRKGPTGEVPLWTWSSWWRRCPRRWSDRVARRRSGSSWTDPACRS